ncbi:PLP-dependent aminotransferase family protein [Pseudonocardia xinjiangensis]|uniref:MocR-like transcription factor YczR n=1 Tax=Pseudonocardia xinjiangensis TaxID=75289 RepID=UPI003D94EC24
MDPDDVGRRIGARSFARLLGDWRPPDGRRLAGALTDRIRLLVLDGRLPLHTRVPAERELATALAVSRTTVATSYDALRDAGVLRSRRGAGSWTRLPADVPGTETLSPFSPQSDRSLFDLAHAALPAPSEHLRTAAAAAVHDLDAYLGGHGYDLVGLPALRSAIAERFTTRGLPTSPDQILVTAGGQHAISLAITALAAPGDRVLVEHPTYPNALDAVATRGARAVPVPMGPHPDGTGTWDLDLLTSVVRDVAPRLAYIVPDFQNPTGALLDPSGRERLVDLARRTGTPLLIDETLAELTLDGPSVAPVASFGAADSPLVLTIGSASKVFWGGLRVGWIRASAPMVRRLAALRASVDLGGPILEQLVVARLLADVEAIAGARRPALAAGRDHLIEKLTGAFPRWRPSHPRGGLCLWVELDEAASSRLTVAARRSDVLLAAGPRFGLDGAFERHLRLPYTLRRDRMDTALDLLASAWRGLDHAAPAVDAEPIAVA